MRDAERDDEAIRRCLAGDREAFGELVERYKRPLYAVAYRLLGDPGLAEDAVQETFLRAYRALGRFRQGDPLAPWLYRIATNLCHDLGRNRARQTPGLDDDQVERQADPGDQPDEVLARRETQRRVREAVAALPEKYRVLVVMAHQQGMTYEAICQATGEPLTIVKNRLYRARQMLKDRLSAYYQEHPPQAACPEPGGRVAAASAYLEGGVSADLL
ncbi:MAG: RNA polymerase sigma factor [Bacillota bacterium]